MIAKLFFQNSIHTLNSLFHGKLLAVLTQSAGNIFPMSSGSICLANDRTLGSITTIALEKKFFPGVSYPYEIPENPDLVVNTEKMDIESSVKKVLDYLLRKKYI